MLWWDICSRIGIAGGYCSGTLESVGWVIIGSFLERFWVTFWCFIYSIFALVMSMHDGL